MKKVLIIANLFHASPRIPGIIRYLSDFGWEPIVLTAPINDDPKKSLNFPKGFREKIRVIEVPYKGDIFTFWRKLFLFFGFKKEKSVLEQVKIKIGIKSHKSVIDYIFKIYAAVFAYPDAEKKWKKPVLKTANQILKKEKFDAIISSSSPVTTHIIARDLKKIYKLPWVADLRDLWTQNHNYPYPILRKIIEKKLEIKTLSSANILTTVSDPLSENLRNLHKKKCIYTITNGFDPKKINNPPQKIINKFIITYTGQIYPGKQDPLKILYALKDLIKEKKIQSEDIEVRFYGPENYWLEKEIESQNLSNIVRQYGKIFPEEAIKKQRESQLLLLLNWENKNQKGVYTGKIFEYLAARRSILAIGGFHSDVIEDLLNQTKTGVFVPNKKDIKKALINFYSEYKRKGSVDYKGDLSQVEKYTYRNIAKKFANILDKLI